MFKRNAGTVALAVMIFSAPVVLWSQNAAPAAQEAAPTTSVAPASVEITPGTLDVHVGEKVKFSAAAKDAAGNAIDEKPSVWFAAPFDLAGADDSGQVTFHAPGVVTVGAVIAGKAGYATVNVKNTKIASLESRSLSIPSLSAERSRLRSSRAALTAILAATRCSPGHRKSRRLPAWMRPDW